MSIVIPKVKLSMVDQSYRANLQTAPGKKRQSGIAAAPAQEQGFLGICKIPTARNGFAGGTHASRRPDLTAGYSHP
jgi:hypothetical protein